MVIQVLFIGISNAIFVSQMVIYLGKNKSVSEIHFLVAPNFIFCIFSSIFQFCVFYSMSNSIELGGLAAALSFILCLRWFIRGYFQNVLENRAAIFSDLIIFSSSLFFVILLIYNDDVSIYSVFVVLILSNILGCLLLFFCFNASGLIINYPDFNRFRIGFNITGRDALRGAITAEFSSNFHLYTVLVIFGPSFVAIIAAANLIFRPVSVVHLSIQQTERAHLRKIINENNFDELGNNLRWLQYFVFGAFFLNLFAALALGCYYPSFIWSDTSSLGAWQFATLLCGLIALARSLRIKESMILQSLGNFSKLADATVVSAIFVLFSAPALAYFAGPVSSLFSILGAEIIMVYLIGKYASNALSKIKSEV